MAKSSKKRCEQLPILHPPAAGIDVDAREVFVAVSADPEPVRGFPTFTRDLNALADWPYNIAVIHVGLGEKDEALAWLNRAYEERSYILAEYLTTDARLDTLHSARVGRFSSS